MANPPPNANELTGVTSAVRSYNDNASDAEKEKKYGQQKWGLFETNYQRNKGISTEQSLQEIEQFAQHGVGHGVQGSGSRGGAGGAGGFGAGGAGGAGGPPPMPPRPQGSSGGFGSGGSGGAGGFGGASRGAGGGTGKFGPGGAGGQDFFAQYQQKEAAKYKPGYMNNQPHKPQ